MIDWLRAPADPVVVLGAGELPLHIRRHPRATRMTLRLGEDGESARVTLPRWGTTREAVKFAQSRAGWLEAQLAKRPPRTEPHPGGIVVFRGRELMIDWHADLPRKAVLRDTSITLGGPRDTLAPRLRRWMQGEARALFADDLAFYASRAGLCLPDFALSNARRRWGSCSSNGNLSFSWRLVLAPEDVLDYVVAHEVAHLQELNHSARFWAVVEELYGPSKKQQHWLKKNGSALHRYGAGN